VLIRRRGFIETGTKQSVTDRLGREVLQQSTIFEKYFSKPQNKIKTVKS